MKMRFVALVALGICSGCAHVREIDRSARDLPAALARVNREVQSRTVAVRLTDGRKAAVRALRLTPDSASWLEGGARTAVPTSKVAEVSFKSRWRGALDGLILGVLIGAPAGALVIDMKGGFFDRAEAAVGGALGGALYGAPVGAIRGGRIRYVFR
jgi:hypothetical protein